MWSNVRAIALFVALASAAAVLGGCMLSLSLNAECLAEQPGGLGPKSCESPW